MCLSFACDQLRGLTTEGPQRWNDVEKALAAQLVEARARVRAALCDDFNTPVGDGAGEGQGSAQESPASARVPHWAFGRFEKPEVAR